MPPSKNFKKRTNIYYRSAKQHFPLLHDYELRLKTKLKYYIFTLCRLENYFYRFKLKLRKETYLVFQSFSPVHL